MTNENRCIKRVPEEFGASMRQCSRKAVKEGLCQQHYDQSHPYVDFEAAEQTAWPEVASTSVTVRQALEWEDDKGPTMKPPYSPPIMVKRVTVEIYSRQRPYLKASGYKIGKRGKVTRMPSRDHHVGLEDFDPKTQGMLAGVIQDLQAAYSRALPGDERNGVADMLRERAEEAGR
jgi:hypothetical protein